MTICPPVAERFTSRCTVCAGTWKKSPENRERVVTARTVLKAGHARDQVAVNVVVPVVMPPDYTDGRSDNEHIAFSDLRHLPAPLRVTLALPSSPLRTRSCKGTPPCQSQDSFAIDQGPWSAISRREVLYDGSHTRAEPKCIFAKQLS